MKRKVFAIIVCASMGLAAGTAVAGGLQAEPSQAETRQQAMQNGPATSQFGYTTYQAPAAPHRDAGPVNPKLMRPLTQRELGMLFNACIAYPECNSAYSQALERYQAQQRAKSGKAQQGQ